MLYFAVEFHGYGSTAFNENIAHQFVYTETGLCVGVLNEPAPVANIKRQTRLTNQLVERLAPQHQIDTGLAGSRLHALNQPQFRQDGTHVQLLNREGQAKHGNHIAQAQVTICIDTPAVDFTLEGEWPDRIRIQQFLNRSAMHLKCITAFLYMTTKLQGNWLAGSCLAIERVEAKGNTLAQCCVMIVHGHLLQRQFVQADKTNGRICRCNFAGGFFNC